MAKQATVRAAAPSDETNEDNIEAAPSRQLQQREPEHESPQEAEASPNVSELPSQNHFKVTEQGTLDLRKSRETEAQRSARQREQGGRLRRARMAAGYPSASLAAKAVKIAKPTYLASENGSRPIRGDLFERYASNYGTNEQWLRHGIGKMKDTDSAVVHMGIDGLYSKQSLSKRAALANSLNVSYSQDLNHLRQPGPDQGPFNLPKLSGRVEYVPLLQLGRVSDDEEDGGQRAFVELEPFGRQTAEGPRASFPVVALVPANIVLEDERCLFAVDISSRDFLSPQSRTAHLICDTAGINSHYQYGVALAEVGGEVRPIAWRSLDGSEGALQINVQPGLRARWMAFATSDVTLFGGIMDPVYDADLMEIALGASQVA